MKVSAQTNTGLLVMKFIIVFILGFGVAYTFIMMAPKAGLALTTKKNPDDAKIEWEFTKIIIDQRKRVEAFPPSAARDAYLKGTEEIGSKRMVTIDEFGEIQDLGAKAELEGMRRALIAQGIDVGE